MHNEHKSPDHLTLTLTLADKMVEITPSFLRSFAGASAPPSLEEWVAAMEGAAHDPKVSAVYIRAVGGAVSLTQAEELRGSMLRLRAAGKPVIFFTDTFGEEDNGTAMYYLAAAASKIVLQPGGFAGFSGIAIEEPFFRGLLDKYGVLPEFEKRSAYKSAMDNLTETHMSQADHDQLTRLLGNLSDHVMQAVAHDRNIEMPDLINLRDAAPIPADIAGKLVDAVQYEDQIKFPAKRLDLDDYVAAQKTPKVKKGMPRIAIVNAEGEINRGAGGGSSPLADGTIGAEDFNDTMQDIIDNKNIKAIVIRLNSPGGSAIASESIMRAVQRVRESGKPVIISMTDVAASGGYYMSTPATKILALPSTLTGSIGVLVGKVSVGGLSKQYNVNWDEIAEGKNAAIFANGRGFTPDERASVAHSADAVYATFKARVAAGRKLSPDAVEAIAQGQVWSGEEAKKNGLVDDLGGLVEAVAAAKQALHLAPDSDIVIEPYPNAENPLAVIQLILHQLGVIDRTTFKSFVRQELSTLMKRPPLEMTPIEIRN
jgi:protease-4